MRVHRSPVLQGHVQRLNCFLRHLRLSPPGGTDNEWALNATTMRHLPPAAEIQCLPYRAHQGNVPTRNSSSPHGLEGPTPAWHSMLLLTMTMQCELPGSIGSAGNADQRRIPGISTSRLTRHSADTMPGSNTTRVWKAQHASSHGVLPIRVGTAVSTTQERKDASQRQEQGSGRGPHSRKSCSCPMLMLAAHLILTSKPRGRLESSSWTSTRYAVSWRGRKAPGA
jgi:hypothetical protein